MKDIYYSPNAKGKKEITLTFVLALCAVISLVLGMTEGFSRSLLQLAFVIFIVTDLFLCIRFFLSSYRYTITEEYGDLMLVVTQTQGKRISTLANFKISDVKRIETADTPERVKALKKSFASGGLRYSYTLSLSPTHLTCLTVRNDYTVYRVLLQTDAVFAGILCEYVKTCPQTEAEEE